MGLENNSGYTSQEIAGPAAGIESTSGVSAEVSSQFSSCVEQYQPKTPIQRVQELLDKQLEITPIFPELYCPELRGGSNVRGSEAPGSGVPPEEQKEKDHPGLDKKQEEPVPPELQKREGTYD